MKNLMQICVVVVVLMILSECVESRPQDDAAAAPPPDSSGGKGKGKGKEKFKKVVGDTKCGCDSFVEPTCGKDGKTYGNDCLMKCQGVEKQSDGKCPTTNAKGGKGRRK